MTDTTRIKEELDKDTRDVSDLWNDALMRYRTIVGVQLEPKFKSVDEMIQHGTEQMNKFSQYRHNKKKVDKLRGLFKENMKYIMVGAQQLVAAATPVFPPATAIGTAFTYMLSACDKVSVDYDVVTAFFEDMSSFLQRITILESRLPHYPAYRNCLMDVFTSLLEMCGYATKYIEQGRFKKWVSTVMHGQDEELADARKKMDKTLLRLQLATQDVVAANTEELHRMTEELTKNQEKQTRMLDTVIKKLPDMEMLAQVLTMFTQSREDEPSRQKVKPGDGKPATSIRVRSFFDVSISPTHEHHKLRDTFIAGTCAWLFEESGWSSWTQEDGEQRFVAITGSPGSGKSHLAAAAYDHLCTLANKNSDVEPHIYVAQFYFRETIQAFSEFCYAAMWIVIQIAEQNTLMCEKINAMLSNEDLDLNIYQTQDVLNEILAPLFDGTSKARLRIIFDGLDELDTYELVELMDFLRDIKRRPELKISVLCTTRPSPNILSRLEEFAVGLIEVGEKQLPDVKALISRHLDTDPGLRRLSWYMKQKISSALEQKANGMLYAEHTLRELNILGRAPLILKHLENSMPENMGELYHNMLVDLQSQTSPAQQEVLKSLFAWLAFSHRPLTLDESLELLNLVPGRLLDLEDELQAQRLSKFLCIADFEERPDTFTSISEPAPQLPPMHSQTDPDSAYNDRDLPLKFQERSMRDFFRNASSDKHSISFRTPAADAHRQLFITCAHILCETVENDTTGYQGLLKYAAQFWSTHLTGIEVISKEDLEVLDAVGKLLTNTNNVAAKIEGSGIEYYELRARLGGVLGGVMIEKLALCAQEMVALGEEQLGSGRMAWANELLDNKQKALVQLAKGHVENWFAARDHRIAQRAYRCAHIFMSKTHLSELVLEHQDDTTQEIMHTEEEILGIAGAFPDTPMEGDARWPVSVLLAACGHLEAALSQGKLGVSECTDPERAAETRSLVAELLLNLKANEAAYNSINDCLSNHTLPPKTLRDALIIRAKIEVELNKLEDAAASYKQARLAESSIPASGQALREELEVYSKMGSNAELVGVVEEWKLLERMTWMTWNYDEDSTHHQKLQRAALQCGRQAFLISVYEEVIGLLDTLDAAAPVRCELAWMHYYICGDIPAARSMLDEVLDGTTTGKLYAFTNVDPAVVQMMVVNLGVDLIYEQFRATGDPGQKAQLLEEASTLRERRFSRDARTFESTLVHHTIVLARMTRKMGPLSQFQTLLDKAFDVCYRTLLDNVGWNDILGLMMMAQVLSNLDGLQKEARILVSAQFSQLDSLGGNTPDEGSSGASTNGEDRKDDQSNDVAPIDEGDLTSKVVYCSGECNRSFRWWGGESLYFCAICTTVNLCEDCFPKRQEYNKGVISGLGRDYCGMNHKYVKGPLEGWKGITRGVMNIEGEEPVKFKDWLEDLKEKKWKGAWERFWKSED